MQYFDQNNLMCKCNIICQNYYQQEIINKLMNRSSQIYSNKNEKLPPLRSQQQLAMNALRQISNNQSFSQQMWIGDHFSSSKNKSKSNSNLKTIKTSQSCLNHKNKIVPFSSQKQLKNKNLNTQNIARKVIRKKLPSVIPKNLIFKRDDMNVKRQLNLEETKLKPHAQLKNNRDRKEQRNGTNQYQNKQNIIQRGQSYGCLIPRQYFTGNSEEQNQKEWQTIKKLIRHRRILSKSFKVIIRKNINFSQSSLSAIKQPLQVKSYNRDAPIHNRNQLRERTQLKQSKIVIQAKHSANQRNILRQQTLGQTSEKQNRPSVKISKLTNLQIFSLKQSIRLNLNKKKFITLNQNLCEDHNLKS